MPISLAHESSFVQRASANVAHATDGVTGAGPSSVTLPLELDDELDEEDEDADPSGAFVAGDPSSELEHAAVIAATPANGMIASTARRHGINLIRGAYRIQG